VEEQNRESREHGEEFWRAAVERIQAGEKVRVVARELGVDVRGLYRWRERFYPGNRTQGGSGKWNWSRK
jgi:transposase-like protein